MQTLKAFATICLLLVLGAPSAQAEPFVVGAGSLLVFDFEGDFFNFTGSGFSIATPNNVLVFFPVSPTPLICEPCTAGDVFKPSFQSTGFFGNGVATFGSTTSNVALSGTLNFDVTPLAFPAATADFITLQTPFSFSGLVRGTQGTTEVFSASLSGSGLVRQAFERFPNGTYTTEENHLFFEFQDAPAATPEPATLLLLGTGVAAVFGRARRKLSVP